MTPKNHLLGKEGEALAKQHLLKKGFSIRAMNYRWGRYEVDIIAEKEDLLLFVEVKIRQSKSFGLPESFVSATQIAGYHEVATRYITEIGWEGAIRFDIIAIYKERGVAEILHIEDAF